MATYFSKIEKLSDDILIDILCLLSVEDILSIRLASKYFFSLTKLRSVWKETFHRYVLDEGLPVPYPYPVSGERYLTATSLDFEKRAVYATRLHRNLTSQTCPPKVTRSIEINLTPESLRTVPGDVYERPVLQIAFCNTHDGHQYLFGIVGQHTLGCWEISSNGSEMCLIAQWNTEHSLIRGTLRVNEHASNPDFDDSQGLLVVTVWGTELASEMIVILRIDRKRGRFVRIGDVMTPIPFCLHAFRGQLIACSNMDMRRVIKLQLEEKPTSVQIVLYTDELFIEDTTRNMAFVDDTSLLVVGAFALELYTLSIPTPAPPFFSIDPIELFVSRTLIWDAVLPNYPMPLDITNSGRNPQRRKPLSILVHTREPAAVAIHHYVLDPVPPDPDGTLPIVPVLFPPRLEQTVPTLPSYDLAYLSPSGRGLWAEIRYIGPKHRSHPTSCFIPSYIKTVFVGESSTDTESKSSTESEGSWQTDFWVGKHHLYERPCGWRDLANKAERLSVAMDDATGRLAIADLDGRIVVLNYV